MSGAAPGHPPCMCVWGGGVNACVFVYVHVCVRVCAHVCLCLCAEVVVQGICLTYHTHLLI